MKNWCLRAPLWLFISTLATCGAFAEMVIFSEVMYHPPPGKPEYIEVYNQTITPFDIANWRLADGVEYEFPSFTAASSNLTFLKPFERILLSSVEPSALRAAYSIPAQTRIYGPYRGNLSDAGETITLRDKNGVALCTLTYEDDGHWPISADGAGHTLVLKNGNRSIDDWRNWTASPQPLGTPGTAPDLAAPSPVLFLNEVHFTSSNSVDWVELFNSSESAVSVDGFFLAGSADLTTDKAALRGVVPAKGVLAFDVSLGANSNGEAGLYLVGTSNAVLRAQRFEPDAQKTSFQAYPPGVEEWYGSTNSSKNLPNDPARNRSIVINEIMFDPPGDFLEGEYIELLNRGTAPVDVSHWRFSEGVTFRFPAGTIVQPGGYLVVAAEETRMRQVYGEVGVLGNFEGRLANMGELIRLEDALGNLVDEVDYKTGGDWPENTKGGGSSMELVHPAMDNDLSSAWRASDESAKSTMKTYRSATRFNRVAGGGGGAADNRELHLHLVGDSHIILEDIKFLKMPEGTNLIMNPVKMSTNGASASGWLIQGTHWASYFDGPQLHLISSGRGDNRPNRAEIDLPGLVTGIDVELNFKARWVSGNPRLIVQTWDHGFATSIGIEVPRNLGTPGRANSRALPNPPPQVEMLAHSPAVPKPADTVKVTARVVSADPLTSVQLVHRLDTRANTNVWQVKPMVDDGTRGDAQSGDGIYTAELTEYKTNAVVVQFYVRAESRGGETSFLPRGGLSRPALYIVDSRAVGLDMRSMRFVLGAYDNQALTAGGTATYNFKFPRLQNHYFNTTLIVNEKEIYYNAEMRQSGSPWTRGGLERGKWKVPDDRHFRGHYKSTWDNDANNTMSHNRVVRHMLYLMGHPVNENEFVRFILNASAPSMREETEPVDNDFLNRNYANGSKGDLYRIDDEWWFTDNWDRVNRDADWSYKASENAGRYRTEWMKRTNEDEDDFTALINFFRTLTTQYTQEQIWRMVDIHATMKMAAVRGYIYDWDSFTLNRGKNGYFYRRPDTGLFQFFHWDSDLAFQDAANIFNSGRNGWPNFYNRPYNRRLFMAYLVELLENYTLNSPRMYAWFQAEEDASSSFSSNQTFYKSWFNARMGPARTFLGANYNRAFVIDTNSFQATTSGDLLAVSGTAPFGVLNVVVKGHPEAQVTWTSDIAWTVSGIRLKAGENTLEFLGQNDLGVSRRTNIVTVTKSGPASVVLAMKANPPSWQVETGQAIELNSDSFDPDGRPVSFSWRVNPPQAALLTTNAAGTTAFVTAAKPGLYQVTLEADKAGVKSQLTREIAVTTPSGFSSFGGSRLQPVWRLDRVGPRDTWANASWYTLLDYPGSLIMTVFDDAAKPLTSVNPAYPLIWRPLPAKSDWVFQTRLFQDNRQYGSFYAGALVELQESGATNTFAIGLDGGNLLSVVQLQGNGSLVNLKSITNVTRDATIRVRRLLATQELLFEQRQNDVWTVVHTLPLSTNAMATKGGLFLSTTQPQTIKTGFEYAMLVDPSSASELQQYLRPAEIMFNPVLGDAYEFIELMNVGPAALNLNGAHFTNGIAYAFGDVSLAPGARIVLVKDRAAFASLYGQDVTIAPGAYIGSLNNGGENLTLADAAGEIIFSVSYGDGGDWPSRPDGFGSSLEVLQPNGDLSLGGNWRSSSEFNGSPGRAGAGPVKSVVINEVLAHTDLPLEDAIELMNVSATAVDVSGWFLSDARGALKKFKIPSGTILAPGGYAVFYETNFNTNNQLVPFSLSSAEGDEVHLVSADAAGNILQFVDDIDFRASENGVSFGRYPNGTGAVVPMSRLTFGSDVRAGDPAERIAAFRAGQGAANAYPKVGPIVISRLMYNPLAGADEFIELRNITTAPVNLFDPAHPTNRWSLQTGVSFEFPLNSAIPASGIAIVSPIEPSQFRAKYAINANTQVFGPFLGRLDNAGEAVELFRPDAPVTVGPSAGLVPQILVDKVDYNNNPPWPQLPESGGVGLRRITLSNYGNDPANWKPDVETQSSADKDGDGMPDEWEIAHGLNADSNADAALDGDSDGLSNRDEYLAGTDPGNRTSVFQLEAGVRTATSVELRFNAVGGKSYSLLYQNNLGSIVWTKWADIAPQAGDNLQNVTIPFDASQTRYFKVVTPKTP